MACGWWSLPPRRGGLVAQEVAEALGVTERPGELLADTLVDSLRGKEMLLVLDNCEHLIAMPPRASPRSSFARVHA
jgi:hypothetical protein